MDATVKKLWSLFLSTPQNERERNLGQFLETCLHVWSKEDTSETGRSATLSPSDQSFLSSFGNILAHYFQSDVHRISRCMSNDDDFKPVEDYLFNERGWKLVAVLSKVSSLTNGLCYNKELASLLIDLLPLTMKLKVARDPERGGLSCASLVSAKLVKENEWKFSLCFQLLSSYSFDDSKSPLTPAKVKSMAHRGYIKHRSKLNSRRHSASSSDSSDVEIFSNVSIHNQSVKLSSPEKCKPTDEVFSPNPAPELKESFISSLGSDATSHPDAHPPMKLLEEHEMNVSADCLIALIANIVNEFLQHEQKCILSAESYNPITYPSVAINVMEMISALFDDKNLFNASTCTEALFQLMFTSTSTLSLFDIGLRHLEKIQFASKLMEILSSCLAEKKDFWKDLSRATISFLTLCAQNLPTTQEYSLVVKFMRIFILSGGQQAVLEFVTQKDKHDLEKLMSALSQLLNALQRAKILWCHHTRCYHRKHTRCDLRPLLHHHDDVLGQRLSHSLAVKSPLCCISSVTDLFLNALQVAPTQEMAETILKYMTANSFCCCVEGNRLIEQFLLLLQKYFCCNIYKAVFSLIEGIIKNQKQDLECCKRHSYKDLTQSTSCSATSDSACFSDNSCCQRGNGSNSSCEVGKLYKNLLKSEDTLLRSMAVKHVWLLIHLDYEPYSFCVCQHLSLPIIRDRLSSEENVEFALTLLCVVLSCPNISKCFLAAGGLNDLCDLLRSSGYTALVVSALEVLILSEIKLLEADEMNKPSESLPALSFYLQALNFQTREFLDDVKHQVQISGGKSEGAFAKVTKRLVYITNLWSVHSKISCCFESYVTYVRSTFAQIPELSYKFLLDILGVTSTEPLFGQSLNVQEEERVLRGLVNVLELMLPVCLRFAPFSCSDQEIEIDEAKILRILKHNIFGFKKINEGDARLSVIVKMLLNCSLWFSKDSFKKLSRTASGKKINKIGDGSSESSGSEVDPNENPSESSYEADDECCLSMINSVEKNLTDKKLPVIYYGDLCKLVVEVLVEFSKEKASMHKMNIIFVCKKLLTLCRENEVNSNILYRNGVSSLILLGFKKLFTNVKSDVHVQKSILDLFVAISYHKIDGVALSAFFSLFKQKNPAFDVLLPSLLDLVSYHKKMHGFAPLHSLLFPGDPIMISAISSSPDSWVYRHHAEAISYGHQTCWSAGALCIPLIKEENPLLQKCKNFSVAVWCCFEMQGRGAKEKDPKEKRHWQFGKDKKYDSHLLSVTLDCVSLEIWLDCESRQFIFRMVKLVNQKVVVIASTTKPSRVDFDGKWHLICFNFREVGYSSGSASLQITPISDGIQDEPVSLVHGGAMLKYANSTSLVLGYTRSLPVCTKFGNLTLFRGDLSLESFLQLYCLGPNFDGFLSCQIDHANDSNVIDDAVASILTKSLLETYLKLNVVDGLRWLQENIWMFYRISSMDYSLSYITTSIQSPTAAAVSRFSFGTIRLGNVDGRNTLQTFKNQVYKFANFSSEEKSDFTSALVEVGGVGVLLMFFAKIVEDTDSTALQAKALMILIRTIQSNSELMNIFVQELSGLQLLNGVLKSSQCPASPEILQAYLSLCLSSNNYREALITFTAGFEALFQSYKAWHKQEATCVHLHRMCEDLISVKNPHQKFNLAQMRKGHTLQSLLNLLQASYVGFEDARSRLPNAVTGSIVDVMYQLAMQPVDLSLINDIMNCILLLHKASNAYVCHTKQSFCFSFPTRWDSLQEAPASAISDEWEVISSESEQSNNVNYESLNEFLSKIIGMLGKIVLRIPMDLLEKTLSEIIKLEFLVVLAYNENFKVRETVLKVVSHCFNRGKHTEGVKRFLEKKGFHLLANQLHQYPSTQTLINTSYSLLTGVEYEKIDVVFWAADELDWNMIERENWPSASVLKSLIPNCIPNTSLCHNTLKILNKLFRSTPLGNICLKHALDNGVVECLLKTLIRIEWNPSENLSTEGYEEDVLQEDIYSVFYSFGWKFFNSPGIMFFQCYSTLLDIISAFERKAPRSVSSQFRNCQIKVLEAAYDVLDVYASADTFGDGKRNDGSFLSKGPSKSEFLLNLFYPTESNGITEMGLNQTKATAISPFPADAVEAAEAVDLTNAPTQGEFSLTESELIDRLRFLVTKSVEFIVYREGEFDEDSEKENFFTRTLMHFLFTSMEIIQNHQQNRRNRTRWSSLVIQSKDIIRSKLIRLLLFISSHSHTPNEILFVASLIVRHVDFIQAFVKANPRISLLLESFLTNVAASNIPEDERVVIQDFVRFLQTFHPKRRTQQDAHKQVISEWFSDLEKEKKARSKLYAVCDEAVINRLEGLISAITENAMSVTRDVVEAQNNERKQFFNNIKQENSVNYATKRAWRELIQTYYHEKALWYFPEAFPEHWELDPTEGPMRIRRKLARCSLDVPEKFFMGGFAAKKKKILLSYLFEKDRYESDSSAFIDRIHMNERIIYTSVCTVVTPADECRGEVLIGTACVHFVGEQKRSDSGSSVVTVVWIFEEIKEVNKCRFQLQNTAVEMYLTTGVTFLIAFETEELCNEFLSSLFSRNLPNLAPDKSLPEVTQLWRERKMTNFEYLTYINKISGRSFNDLMQYPVFPFVLSDYESEILNLENPNSFRKLNRPMAVQHKAKEEYYVNQYNYLKSEYESTLHLGELIMPTTGPYHYGSHYSNSGTVLHFLVRLPPFTQMFLHYQDNSFDIPDRTFHSINTSWRLASGESTTDFKELIPEFFFLPEFLLNLQKFNFGIRQSSAVVDDVILPKWCRNDARLFILIHRQALESDHVTERLNEWVDLVFGWKQSGKAAVDAVNVFHPATYYGVDASKIQDPLKRKALQTMTKTFGQMPKQIFTSPHPTVYTTARKNQSLSYAARVIGEVVGLKWGSFPWSPAEPDPMVVYNKTFSKTQTLVPLLTNEVFMVGKNSCLLLSYSKQKGGPFVNATCIASSAIVTWHHIDDLVRIKFRRDDTAVPLLSRSTLLDKITLCASAPGCSLLFVGYQSGAIAIYPLQEPIKMVVQLKKKKAWLHGHYGRVNVIAISQLFSVAVSGGKDGFCIHWDLNRFCYVRTLTKHDQEVKLIAISPTLGDVASVSDAPEGSVLKVNTINGVPVGSARSEEKITAVCYSSVPEGTSVNVILTGCVNGTVKLWSSWDLAPVRVVSLENYSLPIRCLTFSNDNQYLYAVNEEGHIIGWALKERKASVPNTLTLA